MEQQDLFKSGPTSNEALLQMLLGNITDRAKEIAEQQLEKIRKDFEVSAKEMQKDAREASRKIKERLGKLPTLLTVGTVEKPETEIAHKAFETVSRILSSAKRKEKNIMLVGGAGGGKTHLCSQLARALQLPFYPMSVGLQTTKSDLLGFINATGQYMPSPIRHAYENGGLLLLDEFDAAHAGVVTILNSLLANGHCSFPDKVVDKHKDFVCLCACNTYGRGGTIDYVGRNRLDAATLDRFIIVDVGYDEELEKSLTNHPEWSKIIKTIRKNINKHGIKTIVSPRASMDGADLLEAGFDLKEVLQMTVFKGCDEDTITKLSAGITFKATEKKEVDKKIVLEEKNKVRELPSPDIKLSICLYDNTYKVVYGREHIKKTIRLTIGDSYNLYICPDKDGYSPLIDQNSAFFNNSDEWKSYTGQDVSAFVEALKDIKEKYTGDKVMHVRISKDTSGAGFEFSLNTGLWKEA